MEKNKTLPAGITEEMVKSAKEKWGAEKVKLAELPKDDDGNEFLEVLIRAPNREVKNNYAKWVDKSPGKADEILINACLLSHKEEVKADDDLFSAALDAISKLLTVRVAKIKNV